MYAMMGYGSPRLTCGDIDVLFSGKNPAGVVEWEPVEELYETLSGDLLPRFKGYRAKITLTLYNMRATDYQDHIKLMNIINLSRSSGTPITILPRFSNGISLSIPAYPVENFGYKEITNLNAGQKLDVNFKSKALFRDLPAFVDIPSFLMLDETRYLLLSGDGSRLIIPRQGG